MTLQLPSKTKSSGLKLPGSSSQANQSRENVTLKSVPSQFVRNPNNTSELIKLERDVPISLKIQVRDGKSSKEVEVDHIMPLWLGGTNAEENLQALDIAVHGKKSWKNSNPQNPDSVYNQYKSGLISLPEARVKVLNWEEPDTTIDFLKKPSTYAEASAQIGKGIWNFFTQSTRRYITNTATRVGEAIGAHTKAEKQAEEANIQQQAAADKLMQEAKKAKAIGDTQRYERLVSQANQLNLFATSTLEDRLSDASKSTVSQIGGEAIGATLEVLPFAKGVGFAARGVNYIKKAEAAVEVTSKASKSAKVINMLQPKQLARVNWGQLGKRVLQLGGEGAGYGFGFGLSEVMQHPSMSNEQKVDVLVNSTGIGFVGGAALGVLGEVLTSKFAKLVKKKREITPLEVHRQVQDTIKSTPIPNDKAVIESAVGTKVVTNNKTVLQNYIKNSSRLNYKTTTKLPEGVSARFEWDFKTKTGTIYANSKTTASSLAHELGHFYDRKLTNSFEKKLSDLMPNYKANQAEIDSIFASYAVKKLEGNASKKQIEAEVSKLVDNFIPELDALAVQRGEQRIGMGERFASAFSEVIDNPAQSRKTSPNFTAFVESELERTGLVRVGKQTKYPELFGGESGNVTRRVGHTFRNVAEVDSQAAALKKLVAEGDTKARALFEGSPTSSQVDDYLRTKYKEQGFDAIEYTNKQEGKAPRILEISSGKNFTTDLAEAKVRSLQTPAKRGRPIVEDKVINKVTKGEEKLYRGDSGEVVAIDNTFARTKRFSGEQADALKMLADKGDKEAAALLKDSKKGYTAYDKYLDKYYKEKGYDSIRYGNKDTKKKYSEYRDLENGGSYTPDKVVAEVHAKGRTPKRTTELLNDRLPGKFSTKEVTTKAFNEGKINSSEDTLKLLNTLTEQNEQFSAERGKVKLEDLREFALKYLGDESLYKSVPGEIRENIGKMKAAQQTMVDLAAELDSYLKQIDLTTASSVEIEQAKELMFRLEGVTKSFSGARTEASHLFASLKVDVRPGEADIMKDMLVSLKKAGLESDTLESFVVKKNALFKPTASDKAFSVWYASVLSGPKTSIRNVLSTSFHLTQEIANKFLTPSMWKEIPATLRSLPKGWKLGKAEAASVLKGKADLGKFVESGAVRQQPIKGKFGNMLDYVGRVLNAEDKLLQGIAYQMEKDSLEALRAKGLKKYQLADHVIEEKAKAFAEFVAFRNKPEGIIGAVSAGVTKMTREAPALKVVVPFVRTVANVTNRQLDYIPILNAMRVYKAFADKGSREGNQALARAFVGTVATSVALTKMKGRISGRGPDDYNQRKTLEQTGWRPNSIKFGDKWYPYTYFGSMAGVFALAGNINDAIEYNGADDKTLTDLIAKGIGGWSQTIMDMSFLGGVSNLMDAMTGRIGWDKYFEDLGVGLIPIPAAYTQTKDMFFQTKSYKALDAKEKLLYKIGFVENLQPNLDVFGQQIYKDTIYGISPSQEKYDVVSEFLKEYPDVKLKMPSKSMTVYTDEGVKRTLTPGELTEFLYLSGPAIKEEIIKKIESGYFERNDAAEAVDDIIQEIRDNTKEEMFGDQDKNRRQYNRLK